MLFVTLLSVTLVVLREVALSTPLLLLDRIVPFCAVVFVPDDLLLV